MIIEILKALAFIVGWIAAVYAGCLFIGWHLWHPNSRVRIMNFQITPLNSFALMFAAGCGWYLGCSWAQVIVWAIRSVVRITSRI